jgi:hypothetical protein
MEARNTAKCLTIYSITRVPDHRPNISGPVTQPNTLNKERSKGESQRKEIIWDGFATGRGKASISPQVWGIDLSFRFK